MKTLNFAVVSTISGSLFGYNVAVIAGSLEFMTKQYDLTSISEELLVTSILIGALIGATTSGEIAARWGERRLLLAAALVFLVLPPLMSLAGQVWLVGLLRGVLGLAVGAVSMVAPLYVAECVSARRRGALVSLFQFGVTAGILGAYLVDMAFTSSGDWRAMLALGAVPALVLGGALLPLPESPRWLALKGREDEAAAVLRALQGADADPAELAGDEEVEIAGRWSELFGPLMRGVLMLTAGLFLFQNLSGIDGILYYAPEIFVDVGFEAKTGAILATVGLGTVNLLATIVALLVVDRLGRRPLLIGGLFVMSASLLTLGLLVGSSGHDQQGGGLVTLLCLGAYILAFAVSLGPLPYVLMSEVFPLSVRARGMSLAAGTSWLLNIVVAMTFLLLLTSLGVAETFLFYAAVCLAGLVFAWFLAPETRGRSLAEIEDNLRRGLRLRDLGRAPATDAVSPKAPG